VKRARAGEGASEGGLVEVLEDAGVLDGVDLIREGVEDVRDEGRVALGGLELPTRFLAGDSDILAGLALGGGP